MKKHVAKKHEKQEKEKSKNKTSNSAKKSLVRTIIIVSVLGAVLILVTTFVMLYAPYDIFSTGVSDGRQMNIPFTILIEVLATTSGVILGLQFDNFADEKKGNSNYGNLLLRIQTFISKIYDGVSGVSESDGSKTRMTIFELAEYKMHWDILLQADAFAVQTLQSSENYFELAYIFYFLGHNRIYWENYSEKTIDELLKLPTINPSFIQSLKRWKEQVEKLHNEYNVNAKDK